MYIDIMTRRMYTCLVAREHYRTARNAQLRMYHNKRASKQARDKVSKRYHQRSQAFDAASEVVFVVDGIWM